MCLLVCVYQQSLSEVGDDGLLSGCWFFCLFVCLVRLCLQGQYCSIYNLANKAAEHLCKGMIS